MNLTPRVGICCCAAVGLLALATDSAPAAQFAAAVVAYDPGAAIGGGFTTPEVALGSPDGLSGEGLGFASVVNPFSPPFESDELVQIGEGGSITLRLSHFALPTAGLELGVFTNAGIADEDFPNGKAGSPPFTFGIDAAVVDVSADGATWVSLGLVNFDVPTNFYLDRGPFNTTPGSLIADFGKPFGGTIDDFAGLEYGQILTLLDGSAGGTWLNISATGLSQVGYLRFGLPDDGNPTTQLSFELDAVSLANAAVGSPVPEPSAWLLAMSGSGLFALVSLRNRRQACRGRTGN